MGLPVPADGCQAAVVLFFFVAKRYYLTKLMAFTNLKTGKQNTCTV